MTKKHFIELADYMIRTRPETEGFIAREMQFAQSERFKQWEYMCTQLADFCSHQNPQFNRGRWLAYIAGECGPNGGQIKK